MSYSLSGSQVIQDVVNAPEEEDSDNPPELDSADESGSEPEEAPPRKQQRPPSASGSSQASKGQNAAAGRQQREAAAAAGRHQPRSKPVQLDEPDQFSDSEEEPEPMPGFVGGDSGIDGRDDTGEGVGEDVDSELELGQEISSEEDDVPPGMVSDHGESDDEDDLHYKQPPSRQQQQQQAQPKPATQKKAKPKAKPKADRDSGGDAVPGVAGDEEDFIPGLVSEDDDDIGKEQSDEEVFTSSKRAGSGGAARAGYSDSDKDQYGGPRRGAAGKKQQAKGGKGSGLNTGFFDQQQRKPAGDRRTQYAGAGAGTREDLRSGTSAARPPTVGSVPPPPAAQFAEAQARRRAKAPPGPVAVERLEAELAEDEQLKAALMLQEEERKAMRKKMGLEEDEEAEVEDPVLGTCAYGSQCARDPEEFKVKASHADRYEFRCSEGHRIFYHQPCWRKATVRLVDAKGNESLVVGKDYKWPKKNERKKCVDPNCSGIIMFIEAPHKYSILNVVDEVKKEQQAAAGGAVEKEEVPEWERYEKERELERKERRFKFKKGGKGKKAADEEEEEEHEEPAAPQTGGKTERPQQQQADEPREQGSSAAGPSASAASDGDQVDEEQEESAPTPALPDDRLLHALKRGESSDEELLTMGQKGRRKDKGKGPAREAEIVWEDNRPDKRKKKGVKIMLGAGLSMAEQRRMQQQAQAENDRDAQETWRRPQHTGMNAFDFPDLEEAQQLAKDKRSEDAECVARDRRAAALLSALRTFKAGEFRADDASGPSTLLVENLDYRRIRDEEGTRPEMFLRSTFAEYGPVKDVRMYEACKAALVSFRTTQAAYKAYMLLSQKVLLHSKLAATVLKRMPKEAEVESKTEELLAEAERREAAGDGYWLEEEQGVAAGGSSSHAVSAATSTRTFISSSGRAPLHVFGAGIGGSSSASSSAVGMRGPTSMSVTIPGMAAAAAVAAGGVGSLGAAGAGILSGASSLGTPTNGGLRVGAAEFRPGSSNAPSWNAAAATGAAGPEAASGAADRGQAEQQAAENGEPLVAKFLSAQLIAASKETYQVYLGFAEREFGLPIAYLDRPGLAINDTIALLMYNNDDACIYGVWSARRKEVHPDEGEVVVFAQERGMHPLPMDRIDHVSGLLQWQGPLLKLPQKLPASSARSIMQAFVEHERSNRALEAAQQAAAAAAAPRAPTPPPHTAAQQAQQQQQQQEQQQADLPPHTADWWREEERRRQEQEERDAEIARQLQEQLMAEAQLEEQRRVEEDRRLAAALRDTAPAPAPVGAGYAAAAAALPPPRPPAPGGMGGIFSSLFPGQRPPGAASPTRPAGAAAAAAGQAAASGVRAPSPGVGRAPYRPLVGGYRPPLQAVVPPPAAAASAPASSRSASAVPAVSAAHAPPPTTPAATAAAAAPGHVPTAAPAAAAPPAEPGAAEAGASSAAPAPAAPALKNPCVKCKQRESVHIWIPCGDMGHCEECLPDSLAVEEKKARFPKCLVCGMQAEYYIRMFA